MWHFSPRSCMLCDCRNTGPGEISHPELDHDRGAMTLWEVPFEAWTVSGKEIEYLVLYSLQKDPLGLRTFPRYWWVNWKCKAAHAHACCVREMLLFVHLCTVTYKYGTSVKRSSRRVFRVVAPVTLLGRLIEFFTGFCFLRLRGANKCSHEVSVSIYQTTRCPTLPNIFNFKQIFTEMCMHNITQFLQKRPITVAQISRCMMSVALTLRHF